MIIGISGMISSGKSTLTTKLLQHYSNSILLEEYSENDEVFTTMLDWFYQKRPNLDLSFQAYVVENHLANVDKAIAKFNEMGLNAKEDFLFLDRFSAEHYVFALVNLKNLPKKVMKAYDALFKALVSQKELPEFVIFLDVTYENFAKRLFARGRKVEIDNYETNKAYFKELYEVYKDAFIKIADAYNIKYAIIDTNNLTEEQVFTKAVKLIKEYKENHA
ncbi:deoxynucleoside kinase [Mycoplasmopsis verecunda]|uniref:Deoxyadenosine/deoxycytidine kinase n=1 Tax=Mycoplasmopsis verecunda TaxID=171291 RepID=A0A1T4L9Z8_9BACT|nr:deoxynucleoside kinase [Mycoplasmopsis verecunda]WPB54475.1 deoxynucleoside kinase [Mycoplasmopsis verecunda]SJZ51423.1 Deoxyadenosine/deoxycytidine kinase [Mycoplasmopsis verecunda]